MKLVQDVYGRDIAAARLPAEKLQLAQRLMRAAMEEQRDSAAQFVLFTLAIDDAASAGDVKTAFDGIAKLESAFLIDGLKFRADVAASTSKSLASAENRTSFVSFLDPMIDQAMQADRYDVAKQMAETDATVSHGADPALARQALLRLQQVREAQAAFEEAKVATAMLKRNPKNPEASLKVGWFRCFVKQDWEHGLPLLAAANDPPIRDLARHDLAGATTVDQEAFLGDEWWDYAPRLSGSAKAACQQRAVRWYQQALATLDKGLLRDKLEKRVAEAGNPPAKAQTPVTIGSQGPTTADPAQFAQWSFTWSKELPRPKTTLAAQRIDASLTLKQENSPYLISGMVMVAPGASLTIEPGTVVMFAPQVRLQIEGTLTAESDGPWIAFISADGKTRWGGLESRGQMNLKRCVFCGADVATSEPNGSVTAKQCVWADNGIGLDIGNNGKGSAEDCISLRNETGLIAHGDAGHVNVTRFLFIGNKRGLTTNFYGTCDASNCTFYGNQTAIEAAERGWGVRVNLSNILTTTGRPLGTRGGKAIAAGNYWGLSGPPSDPSHDTSGALSAPVSDAMPKLPNCEFIVAGSGTPMALPSSAPPAVISPPSPPPPASHSSKLVLSGDQTDDVVTLSAGPKPYLLQGTYRVPDGKRLEIQAGTIVVCDPHAGLQVGGSLTLSGTAEKPVEFRGTTRLPSSWAGIVLDGAKELSLEHVNVFDGEIGVQVLRCKPQFKGCVFADNHIGLSVGRYDGGSHQAALDDCVCSFNTSDGIQVHGGSLALTSCTVTKNGGWGVMGVYYVKVQVKQSIVSLNNGGGIQLAMYDSTVTAEDSVLVGNKGLDLQNKSTPEWDLRRNYWGTNATAFLKQRGPGAVLPTIIGKARVDEFLTQMPKECGASIKKINNHSLLQ